MLVHGASVKLVVNAKHEVVGLVSALLPNVQLEDLGSWAVTAEQAEQVVRDQCASEGNSSARIVQNATERTLIALEYGSELRRYAWVVYTNNYLNSMDVGYLAHYVNSDGDYLYALPVSEPGSNAALEGEQANFAFDQYETGTWKGKVTKHDGSTMEVEVPVLVDPNTGAVLLGDAKRKILCVDFAEFEYNDNIVPRVEEQDGFASNEVLIYNAFIKAWDFYDSIGWTGPDGMGTPAILKLDMVDQNGEVVKNAFYQGKEAGFQTFAFNRLDADGECYDLVTHEFVHCVTSTTMTTNLYINDMGAINESMSDIMGNLVEMMIAYDKDGAWIIGEGGGDPVRSMKDPHEFNHPEFVWDVYYGPAVTKATSNNDNGGVHINSSLLNFVSYKLNQAGMSPEDQFYFWMNVALAITPSTDFPQMAEILPWCMSQTGYTQYVDAVKKAVDEARLTVTAAPSSPAKGCGFVRVRPPEQAADDINDMCLIATPYESDEDDDIIMWAGANSNDIFGVVPAGSYSLKLEYGDEKNAATVLVLTEDGWVEQGDDVHPKSVPVVDGETTNVE